MKIKKFTILSYLSLLEYHMLPFFLTGSVAWADQMMAIAAEIGLHDKDDAFKKQALDVFVNAGDSLTRVSQAGAFMYYAEKPPFNINAFNHWHFKQTPINPDDLEIIEHSNDDNVVNNLKNELSTFLKNKVTRSWPWSLHMKMYLSFICDIYSPLHLSEYFSQQFPEGDDNGRKFKVIYDNKETTLYDLWESGCGLYHNISSWTKSEWEIIDKKAKELNAKHPSFEEFDLYEIVEETYNYTRDNVYGKLSSGDKISDEYISMCRNYVENNMVRVGRAIAEGITDLQIAPITDDRPQEAALKTRDAIAWSIALVLTPFAALLIWKKHFSGK